jgi:hypothetical protein
MDELRRQLREASGAHRPDRARMLARVQRSMDGPAGDTPGRPLALPLPGPAGRAPWLRIAGATAAVAGVLTLGGYAVTSVVLDGEPRQTAAAPPALPTPAAQPSPPARSPLSRSGYLQGEGAVDPHSNAYWTQANVVLTTDKPLTSLTLELRIAQAGGVAETGGWRTLPAEDFTVSIQEENGALVYRWTLKSGRTVPAGRHIFAGQYDHAESGRDTGHDTYTASARAAAGNEAATVRGGFAPPLP